MQLELRQSVADPRLAQAAKRFGFSLPDRVQPLERFAELQPLLPHLAIKARRVNLGRAPRLQLFQADSARVRKRRTMDRTRRMLGPRSASVRTQYPKGRRPTSSWSEHQLYGACCPFGQGQRV